MDRRTFLTTASAVAASASLAEAAFGQSSSAKRTRVAVIGHTGRGNYGHGLDTVWLDLPETEIVAVADADATGLAAAQKRLGTTNGHADYRAMLQSARPDVTAVCPRHVDEHCGMILAAIEAGSRGIYVEKPLCRTPEEADRIIAACDKAGTKLAVAHRNRYQPVLAAVDQVLADGGIGKVLEIRGRGKGDKRGGGEDLWVLGSHVLNLITYFGGPPTRVTAVMKQDGKLVTKADVKEGNEGVGPLAANEIHARLELPRVPVAYFDSLANDDAKAQGFGLQIIGSAGVIDIKCDRNPFAQLIEGNPFQPTAEGRKWVPITTAGVGKPEPAPERIAEVMNHVIPCRDLLAAMNENREPLCSARDAAQTLEVIMGIFASHAAGGAAVMFPLADRGNPLAKFS